MMVIENQIIKDKLAGLLNSFSQLINKKSEGDLSIYYLNSICIACKTMNDELLKAEQKYLETHLINEDLNYRLVKLSNSHYSLALNQEQLLSQMKEKLLKNKEKEELIKDERDRAKNKVETLENNCKILSDEYDKLRKRMKQAKFRYQGEDTERVCVNCKKLYNEEENFNWSCKIHTSQFGEFWWCCGKTDRNAVGCKALKHESIEEKKEKEQTFIERKAICTSCKKPGHEFFDCPKDPNAKTNIDAYEEKQRLAEVVKENNQKLQKRLEKNDTHTSLHQKVQEYTTFSESDSETVEGFQELLDLKTNSIFEPSVTKNKISFDISESPFELRKLRTGRKSKFLRLSVVSKIFN